MVEFLFCYFFLILYRSLCTHWKSHGESGALCVALRMDFAVVGLHDALRDRKAEAITALRTGAGAVHPVKPLKDMGDLIRGNLIAGIMHC